jgi:acyl transferase domain-containing protein
MSAPSQLQEAILALRRMGSKLDALERARREPIAIVGLGCRFPGGAGGAHGPEQFWRLLRDGVDAVTEVPADRWDVEASYDPEPGRTGKNYCRWGGFVDGVDRFDARFFGIAPREAASMDPQQRLVLETTWEALEHAGIAPARLAGSAGGVFLGVSTSDYLQLGLWSGDPERIDPYSATGGASSVTAGRVSYLLGLRGPSLAVNTACSSSLVALHLACQSLRAGECDLALAGGVNLMLSPIPAIALSAMKMMAGDGRCKTFDAAADGFVRGEGCGIVVLRRLADAEAAGDRILAVVLGSAVNQDGHSGGLTAPNGPAQEAVIRGALAAAGVEPGRVGYVEAHGTGTSLGDPIEIQALATALAAGRPPERPLRVGSVKTNIGHLEAAAGVAGLIKAVLTLQHGEIPPHLHLRRLNPHIDLAGAAVEIPTQMTPWPAGDAPRVAGVSSFGFSGTNAHIVLAEHPVAAEAPAAPAGHPERPRHLYCLSARTPTALVRLSELHAGRLSGEGAPPLADAAFTANAGRSHFPCRLAVVATDNREATAALEAFAAGREAPGLLRGPVQGAKRPGVAFLFSGQGAQYAGMGRKLYETQPTFRRVLERCDEALRPELGRSLLSLLFEPEPGALDQTGHTQPALFALEVALATLWRSWGIEPAALLGHSVGEYAAACVAGVFGLEDGARLVARRARLMQELPAGGAMAAVFASEARVAALLAGRAERLALAAVNGPEDVVLSGEALALEEALAELAAEGVSCRRLPVSHAFHSPLLDPALDRLEEAARQVSCAPPGIPLISNLTGRPVAPGEMADPGYWRHHARRPVRFADGLASLRREGCSVFVEIGPGTSLSAMGRRSAPLADTEEAWLPSLRAGRDEWETLLHSLGELYVRGADADWEAFDHGFDHGLGRRRVSLPTYPFEGQRHWIETGPPPVAPSVPSLLENGLYRVEWCPVDLAPADAGDWLILGDGALAEALARHLTEQGGTCQIASRIEEPGRDWSGVVHLASTSEDEAPKAALEETLAALEVVQTLSRRAVPSRLWLVTRGARPVEDGERPDLAGAPLRGLGRVIAREHPELWGGLIDLPAGAGADEAADLARALLQAPAGEDELALRQGRLLAARLRRIRPPAAEPFTLRPEATWWITGGLGSLGLRVARWMADRGARHLALTGRREPSPEARAVVADLEGRGVSVQVIQADVADPEQAARALATIEATAPPVRGVIHAAGVLEDGVLLRQDRDRCARVFAPKVDGAWNLHVLTRGRDLDLFVLFSSSAALLGSPGQGGYAAANAFLDALAAGRRAAGLPGLSVAWSAWDGGGMAADRPVPGVRPLAAGEALAALGTLLAAGERAPAHAALLALDWDLLLAEVPGRVPGLLTELGAAERPGAIARVRRGLREELAGGPLAERTGRLRAFLRAELGAVLGLAAGQAVPPDEGFFDLGMDSLMALELRNRLQTALGGESLPSTLAFDYPTLDRLTRHLAERLGLGTAAATAGTPPGALAADEPIAIVGLGCRFPGGADSPEAFWRLLRDGVDAIVKVPRERWDADALYDPDPDAPGRSVSRWGGFLDAVDRFDAEFFGISPREALAMDPQQRLLLEIGWQALEDANLLPSELTEQETGVFVGIGATEYAALLTGGDAARIDAYAGVGNALSAAAGRLSYALGLRGPSLAIDTACSSSLVAIDAACMNLRAGRCRIALAGGVSLMLSSATQINLSQARMLAPDGRCKTFDAAADGYVRGEGCGLVVLKRLSDALADGDLVRAVIAGTAVNQDGRSAGLTVPNGPAQEAVLRAALAAAGLAPSEVDYVEAHGTGTALGDPIEVGALAAVYGEGRDAGRPLLVGSVKTNLGHLESAAGVAGLIKAVLALEHGEVPPHLHCRQLNPHIPWDGLPVRVAGERRPWPEAERPRAAAVSSFGFVGTNAHAVLRQAPPPPAPTPVAEECSGSVLVLSARDEAALSALAGRYRQRLAADPDLALADLCHTANTRRARFPHRLVIQVEGTPEEARSALLAALAAAAEGRPAPGLSRGMAIEEPPAVSPGRRVRLPTYPFRGERFWPAEVRTAADRSLLGLRLRSASRDVIFEARLDGSDPGFLADHRIGGGVVVPGAHLLAMALAAAEQLLPGSGTPALEEVAFRQPLALPTEGARSLQLLLERREDGSAAFRAASADAAVEVPETWTEHASGRARRLPPAPDREVVKNAGPDDSVARAEAEILYERLGQSGVGLGPGFRWIERLGRAPGEALARMRAASPEEALPKAPIHPGLLDSCFQALGAALPDQGETPDLFLPLGVDRLVLYGRPGEGPFLCRARCREAAGARAETYTGDIELLDAGGRLLLAIEGLHLKRAARELRGRRLLAEAAYVTRWQPTPIEVMAPDAPRDWLVLSDRGGVGAALAERLRAAGERCSFREDLDGLEPGATVGVVDLRGLDAGTGEDDPAGPAGVGGGALPLVQALLERAGGGLRPRLWLVTRGAQGTDGGADPAAVAQAALWGFGATLALEHPELRCVRVDLDPTTPAAQAAAELERELRAGDGEDRLAWRGGVRSAERLARQPLAPETAGKTVTFDPAATYLVTGGLGGLGLEIARWMAAHGARHLVLCGRRPAEAAAGTLDVLRQTGAEPTYIQADVASAADVARLFGELEADRPPLRGLIHAAGVIEDGVVLHLTAERCAAVMAPKVRGAWNLHLATREKPLDFFVLFSSAAGLLGSPGQASYSAANTFLDALARHRRAAGLPALSLAWGAWSQVGTAARRGLETRLARRHLGLLAPEEALAALGHLLATPSLPPVIALLPVDWDRFGPADDSPLWRELARDARAQRRPAPAVAATPLRPALDAALPADRRQVLAEHVALHAARVLGLAADRQVPARRPLGELGLDSLMAVEMRNALGASTDLPLPATLLFDYPSVEELTDYLAPRLGLSAVVEATATPEAVSAAAALAVLSEEALDAVIAEELGRILADRGPRP